MKPRKVLLVGGGTAGSVMPLIAIQQELKKRSGGKTEFRFVGEKGGIEERISEQEQIPFFSIPAGKLRRYFDLKNLTDPFKIIAGYSKAFFIMRKFKPDIVLTAGSFVAVPVVFAAKMLGIPSIVHQQDINKGLANKLLTGPAHTITVALKKSLKDFPEKKTVYTGNPVRSKILGGSREKGLNIFNLRKDKPLLLVLGGGTGALTLNKKIQEAQAAILKLCQIVHVTGKGKSVNINHQDYHQFDFIHENLEHVYAAADIVITRAGMSTLFELSALKKPIIIVPLPDSHQQDNAVFFEKRNAAQVVSQELLSPEEIESLLRNYLLNPNISRKKSENIAQFTVEKATEKYVDLIETILKDEYLKRKNNIHFIGIGGMGMSAAARIALEAGLRVSGSDLVESVVTQKLKERGAQIFIGEHSEKNIIDDVEVVVHSNAVKKDNRERVAATQKNVRVMNYPEFIGNITKGKRVIAVCGTHGKTTTSMIGKVLIDAGLDPTVIVGSYIQDFEGNAHIGKSNIVVLEADEYKDAFLHYSPEIAVVTSLDYDHPDYFKSFDQMKESYRQFVAKVPENGKIIAHKKDTNIKDTFANLDKKIIWFGINEDADVQAKNLQLKGETRFDVQLDKSEVSDVVLSIPGRHNIQNALAATAVTNVLGVSLEQIKITLKSYKSAWRRFDRRGVFGGVEIIDDYAHHPKEVAVTLKAARELFPEKRIVAFFQPHHQERTKMFVEEFTKSFEDADVVALTETYIVPGREMSDHVPIENIAQKISETKKETHVIDSLDTASKDLETILRQGDALLVMGAGDINNVTDTIIKARS